MKNEAKRQQLDWNHILRRRRLWNCCCCCLLMWLSSVHQMTWPLFAQFGRGRKIPDSGIGLSHLHFTHYITEGGWERRVSSSRVVVVWWASSAAPLWLVFKNNAHHQLFVHPVILTCEERRSDVGLLGVCIEKNKY